jgi:hypothetical protein
VIKQWFLDKLLESLKDDSIPENFKEFVRAQDMETDKIATMIEANPRVLFDVFDEHKLYIQITGNNDQWDWKVGSVVENSLCVSRKDAEKAAIEQAFQMLNDKL